MMMMWQRNRVEIRDNHIKTIILNSRKYSKRLLRSKLGSIVTWMSVAGGNQGRLGGKGHLVSDCP